MPAVETALVQRPADARRAGNPERTHARFWSTAAKLAAVTLELAQTTPATQLTVGDIVRRAGVNRSTFYSHSRSPMAILSAFLRAELEATDQRIDPEPVRDRRAGLESVIRTAVDHVNRHFAVYETALADEAAAGALFHDLTDHVSAGLTAVDPSLDPTTSRVIAAAGAELIRVTVPHAAGEIQVTHLVETLHAVFFPEVELSSAPPRRRGAAGVDLVHRQLR